MGAIFKTSGSQYLSDNRINQPTNQSQCLSSRATSRIIMLFKPEMTNSILRAVEGSSMLGIRVGGMPHLTKFDMRGIRW